MQGSATPLTVGRLAALVSRAARQVVALQVEPLGLSTQQFWALVHIAEHGCASQSELAARMAVDEATACRVVRALADAGWLSPARDGSDRRRVRLALTRTGQALVARLLPIAQGLRFTIETALTPEERAATQHGLAKVLDQLARAVGALDPALLPSLPARRRPAQRARHRAAAPLHRRGTP